MEDIITLRRRKLNEVRQKIMNQTPDEPFTLSSKLISGESISEFVVGIAMNIHKKRTKNKKKETLS